MDKGSGAVLPILVPMGWSEKDYLKKASICNVLHTSFNVPWAACSVLRRSGFLLPTHSISDILASDL